MKIPIILVSGFLGTGKTTFINWLLEHAPDKKISVVLNEFGNINLESQFVKKTSGEVIELPNGCMCCVAKKDVPRIIKYILEKSPQTEYIAIEASGLSDADPIKDTLDELEREGITYLEEMITIIDAVNFEKMMSEHSLVMAQAADADILVISKAIEAGDEAVSRISQNLHSMMPEKRIIIESNSMSASFFLDYTPSERVQKAASETEHHHDHDSAQTMWYISDKHLDLSKLRNVLYKLPPEIIRAKGIINSTEGKLLLQYVAGKMNFSESEWGSTEEHKTQLLIIGTTVDNAAITHEFESCEAS